jgi:hypothetical protein
MRQRRESSGGPRIPTRIAAMTLVGGLSAVAIIGCGGNEPAPVPSAQSSTARGKSPRCDPSNLDLRLSSHDSQFPGTSGQQVITLELRRTISQICRITAPIALQVREPSGPLASSTGSNPIRCRLGPRKETSGTVVVWSLLGNARAPHRLQLRAHLDGISATDYVRSPGCCGRDLELRRGSAETGRAPPASDLCASPTV